MTGEQGYVDDERSCFWTWDDTEGVWQSRPYKVRVRRGPCLLDQRTQRQERIAKKAMMTFRRVVFALTIQIKAQARIIPRTKERESSKKEKARKKLILNPDFQPLKHLKKKEKAMPGIGQLVCQSVA